MLTFETERALVASGAAGRGWRSSGHASRALHDRPQRRPATVLARDPACSTPRGARGADDRLRRLAHAGPVRLDPRGASGGPGARRACSTCRTWASCLSRARTPARPLRGARHEPAGARGRSGPLLDDLRRGRRHHRRPDRLSARRGPVHGRRQRVECAGRLGRPRRAAGRVRAVLDDRSLATGLVAIQGPRALDVLRPLTDVDLDALRYYAIAEGQVAGIPALRRPDGLHRRGRLRGLRRHRPDRRAVGHAARLRSAPPMGVPVGLGARDTLRLEAGMPLYGNELDRDDDAVRRRPRSGRQARQGRRLRRSRGPRARRPPTARSAVWSGSSSRAAASPGTATRSTPASADRRRDQRHPVADARRADRDGLRRTRRRRAGHHARRRDPRRARPRAGRTAAVLSEGQPDVTAPDRPALHPGPRVGPGRRGRGDRRDHPVRRRPARRHRVRRAARRRPRSRGRRRRSASSNRSRPSATCSHRSPARSWPINGALAASPELVNSDPYGDGWMVQSR